MSEAIGAPAPGNVELDGSAHWRRQFGLVVSDWADCLALPLTRLLAHLLHALRRGVPGLLDLARRRVQGGQ